MFIAVVSNIRTVNSPGRLVIICVIRIPGFDGHCCVGNVIFIR